MQWSPPAAVLLALLLVVAGAAPAAATALSPAGDGAAGTTDATVLASSHAPPDPDEDVLGWENGYWADEAIDVNTSDGVNASELNATVARAMARVELLRGLEFLEPVPTSITSREAFRAEQANRTTNATLAVFDNAKFEALLLIGESDDSIAVQNENTGSNVLAYYSPAEGAIVLISEDGERPQVSETTLAHELVHALQDQHFNLSRFDARTRDGANAESGLVEGDASYIDWQYDRECGAEGRWNGTCVAPPASFGEGSGGSPPANWGVYFVKFQPYSDGPRFVASLRDGDDWSAVNAAYDAPPASTEQVIYPEKYLVDEPRAVDLEDTNGPAWERVRPPGRPDYGVVGEGALASMLVYPIYHSNGRVQIVPYEGWLNRTADGGISSFDPLNYENEYTSGWDGDRLHVYRNDADETAYVWRLAWDSPGDAREFVNGYLQALEYWGAKQVAPTTWVIEAGQFADAFHVSVTGDEVTIVNAPTVEALREVRAGVETTPTPAAPTRTVVLPTVTPEAPATDSPTAPTTETPGQPGLGALAALAALLLAVLVARRRT